MDLKHRLGAAVELAVPEIRDIVDRRIASGLPHGLSILHGDLDGYFWRPAKTLTDGSLGLQWKASPDRYKLDGLSDEEIQSVLVQRLNGVAPETLTAVRNAVTLMDEACAVFESIEQSDRDALSRLFSSRLTVDGQMKELVAALKLSEAILERQVVERSVGVEPSV